MKMMTKHIPQMKEILLKEQNSRCALCRIDLSDVPSANICLDHCHTTGQIRGVLCRNCNGCEGKIYNLARRAKRDGTARWWLGRLLEYWLHHDENQSGVYHPTYKTQDEKKLIRNKKARERRAAKK